MMMDSAILQTRLRDIYDYARKNQNQIGYETVIDIITDKNDSVCRDDLDDAIQRIAAKGIQIIGETDEAYSSAADQTIGFIPAEVKIGQQPLNIYNLMERLENDEIDLEPAYQRKRNLWSIEAQSRLIESLMLKIPIPTFYFDATQENEWKVIDGLQRLCAIQNFLVGTISEETGRKEKKVFTGFEYLKEFNGKTFDDLPRQYSRRIKETIVSVYTVEKGTPEEIVYNIFKRINTGSLKLSDQEIRHALYHGKATEAAQELAGSREFLKATQGKIQSDRMADSEYVTRYMAFTQLDYDKCYKGDIDAFLIEGLKYVNRFDDAELALLKKTFRRVMRDVYAIFGKYAFRKYQIEKNRRGPINKAIFEAWSVIFACRLDAEQIRSLKERKEELLRGYERLLAKQEYAGDLRSGAPVSVRRRIKATEALVEKYL